VFFWVISFNFFNSIFALVCQKPQQAAIGHLLIPNNDTQRSILFYRNNLKTQANRYKL
jgi:hypothetical protein